MACAAQDGKWRMFESEADYNQAVASSKDRKETTAKYLKLESRTDLASFVRGHCEVLVGKRSHGKLPPSVQVTVASS